jgi:uncharacterized Zn finger protein (UPF0148 family)
MGSLLLQGWAMLEECCDECNVPLMRNRAKDKEVCVECNRDYKAATDPKPVEKPTNSGAAITTTNPADDTLALKRLEEEK